MIFVFMPGKPHRAVRASHVTCVTSIVYDLTFVFLCVLIRQRRTMRTDRCVAPKCRDVLFYYCSLHTSCMMRPMFFGVFFRYSKTVAHKNGRRHVPVSYVLYTLAPRRTKNVFGRVLRIRICLCPGASVKHASNNMHELHIPR